MLAATEKFVSRNIVVSGLVLILRSVLRSVLWSVLRSLRSVQDPKGERDLLGKYRDEVIRT